MNAEKFRCKGIKCKNHCCGAYDGVSQNLIPINGIKSSEIILLPKDVEKIRECGREDLIKSGDNGISTIKTYKDGTCYALKNGKCEIYANRPSICKAYPLYLDMFTGVNRIKECEAFVGDICVSDCGDSLKALIDVYQFWVNYIAVYCTSS